MNRNYIGLSLSFCIQDILKGKITPEEIIIIITSTRFDSWQEAYEHYFISYWSQYADDETVKQVLQSVWHLINQPRLTDFEYRGHSIATGFWFNTNTGQICTLN